MLIFNATWVAAYGARFKIATNTGIMQQPSSHFYHAYYGIGTTLETASSKLSLRTGYFERPVYNAHEYIEQDFGFYTQIGTKLTNWKSHNLYSHFGPALIKGYLKSENVEPVERRSYQIRGVNFSFEYLYSLNTLEFGVSHSQFVGSTENEQLESLVAWPFAFYSLVFGYRWND